MAEWRTCRVVGGALAVALFGASCGAGATSDASCAGEWFPVGDDALSFVGKGGSSSDSYVVTDLVLRNTEGERVVISIYDGAVLSLPATAMNGYTPWNGYRVEVLDASAPTPEGAIGPCAVFGVEPLPADWHPPGEDDSAGH